MTVPDVSIVVCTHNRASMLRGALASLSDLATEGRFQYEIVVVDNASTDATPQVIAAAAATSVNVLRGVAEPLKGIVAARNRGIREARGRWIAFFDDDQWADARWLLELCRGAAEKRCLVVGGSVHLSFTDGLPRKLHPGVRMLLGEALFGDESRPYGGRLTPGCGNLMIERSVFEEVGAFERTVSGRGEDTDLFSRIERARIAAWYLPRAIVHHLTPPERLENDYLLSLARRMGAGVADRQAAAYPRWRFALLWLAKALRLALVQMPTYGVAHWLSDPQASLGRRALAAINASFLQAGWRWLWSQKALHAGPARPPLNDFEPQTAACASLAPSAK